MPQKPSANSPLSQALSRTTYLAALPPELVDALASRAAQMRFAAGDVVLVDGEPSRALSVVLGGWLKAVRYSPAGREQVLRVVGPGEVFSAIAMLVGAPNPATVVALEPARVANLPAGEVLQALARYPGAAEGVIRHLAGRVLELLDLVETVSLHGVEARLARWLLDRAEGGTVYRPNWATQAEMAAQLGTVPDVLNRALRGLVEADQVEVSRSAIRLLDIDGLALLAGRSS